MADPGRVRTAVIPAAGLGTRFLPTTKAIPKELLPVVDRPTIQYAVEEAVSAGVERVVIVTRPGKEALRDFFTADPALERHLEETGHPELAERVRRVTSMASFEFVTQAEPLGLGHAVLTARELVGDETFCVLLPDDVFRGPVPCIGELVEVRRESGGSVLALLEVGDDQVSRFGIVAASESGDRLHRVSSCLEKPPLADAPSRLGILGRYVLEPAIFDVLERQPRGLGGEIQLTDALSRLAGERVVWGLCFRSTYHDTGTPAAYVQTSLRLALEDPEMGPRVRSGLHDLLG
ncbi:MAG: UTP--glucose-1-phosphate uridylyltransferase [Candidatus Dormibacteria bacterium]